MTVAKPVFSKHAGLCDISKDSMWPHLPIEAQVFFHTKTSHSVCTANQMTGFYVERNIGMK